MTAKMERREFVTFLGGAVIGFLSELHALGNDLIGQVSKCPSTSISAKAAPSSVWNRSASAASSISKAVWVGLVLRSF